MRILLTHNNYQVQGGAEVFYHEIGRVLKKNGHEVAYFSSLSDSVDDDKWKKYFPKVASYANGSYLSRVSSFPSMVYNHESKKKMLEIIDDFRPDIIHAFAIYVQLTPSILEAACEKNVPVVMSCNDYKLICPSYKLYHHGKICEDCKGGKFYKSIRNKCSHDSIIYSTAGALEAYVHNWMDIYRKNVHTFLFSSEFMALKYQEFWGADTFRWKQLRNPFDSTKFTATFNPEGAVLYFGRIIDEKGVDILLYAASKLNKIDFRIVGDGPDLEKLKKLAIKLNLRNVIFTGPKWGEEMEQELKKCSFVVVPSVWHENFPYVINQSFALGKPVVGSNRGGIPEMVKHGSRGLIYKANDSEQLATSIQELWEDPNKIKMMSKNCKAFSDREFNDDSLYNVLEDIYTSVIS